METVLFVIAILVMIVGVIGSVVPIIPAVPIVYLGYFIYGFGTDWKEYGLGVMVLLDLVTVAVGVLDYLAGAMGAKKFGASRLGFWGSIIGAIVGLIFFNVIGLILGPFVGAVIGELFMGRSLEEALRAGWGAFLGFVAGSLFKFLMGLMMIGLFLILVFIW